MGTKSKRLGLLLVPGLIFLFCFSATAQIQVPCNDPDGDRHGVGCAAGLDCDQNDPSIYFGAPELGCDGKDNNCNGAVDELVRIEFPDVNLAHSLFVELNPEDPWLFNTDFCGVTELDLEFCFFYGGPPPEAPRTAQIDGDGGPAPIKNLSGIEYAYEVEYLDLACNQISDLKPLRGLSQLEYLDLSQRNGKSDLRTVQDESFASRRLLSDISPLKKLTNLQYLDLSGNMIRDISPLSKLKKLKELYLAYNLISDISPLSGLQKLGYLQLLGNLIKRVPALDLPNLEYLGLNDNSIFDLSGLAANFKNLEYLDLSGNYISNLKPLVENKNIGEGDDVDLYNNPLTENACHNQLPKLWDRGVEVDQNVCPE